MLPSILIIAGGTIVVTVTVESISNLAKKIKNRKKDDDVVETPEPEKTKKRKMTREQALKKLQEKIDAVNKDNQKIENLISKKLNSLKIEPNTPEHKAILAKAIRTRWEEASSKYIANIQKVMEGLKKHADFESIIEKTPTLISAEEFVEKSVTGVVPSVSEKYRYYMKKKEEVEPQVKLLDLKGKKPTNPKIIASKDVISTKLAHLESKIIDSTKISEFKLEADEKFVEISNEVLNIKQFAKIKKNLQNAIEATKALDKKKANKEEVESALQKIEEEVKQNKDKLDLIDLDEINKTIEKLQNNFGELDETLSSRLKNFGRSINRAINSIVNKKISEFDKLVDSKISNALSDKADAKELREHMAEVRGLLDGFGSRLELQKMLDIEERLIELTEAYNNVNQHIDDSVKAEVEKLKETVKKSINVSIGLRISNKLKEKLKDFDEAHKKEIIEAAVEEAKKAAKEAATDEESIDAIVTKVVEDIVISKKSSKK